MPPQLNPEPDPLPPLPSDRETARRQPEDASFHNDLADLAARFSTKSGGGLSPELAANLALEVVLNRIVERACLATGATGAAIVLRRDGEMVCRASSGSTAPGLGSRLDTSSGLSGECLRTRRTQRSDDALGDLRADVEASRRLGVRSVMVMPLVRRDELLGVFELFSTRPFAFGDRDEGTLDALASCILASLDQAARPLASAEVPPISADPDSAKQGPEKAELLTEEPKKTATARFDFVILALTVVVLVCAVLLGVLVGRHFGLRGTSVRLHSVPQAATVSGPAAPVPALGSSSSSSRKAGDSGEAVPHATFSKPDVSNAVPPGGLLIYENGKEIFRMPPTPGEPGTAAANREAVVQRAASLEPDKSEGGVIELPPALAESSVVYRVEPEYPEEARQQKVQGDVVLGVSIGADGRVEDIQLVSGPPPLAVAASKAVKQWRFKTGRQNGQAVRMQTRITLSFRLPG